jgi:hypothetical protein
LADLTGFRPIACARQDLSAEALAVEAAARDAAEAAIAPRRAG